MPPHSRRPQGSLVLFGAALWNKHDISAGLSWLGSKTRVQHNGIQAQILRGMVELWDFGKVFFLCSFVRRFDDSPSTKEVIGCLGVGAGGVDSAWGPSSVPGLSWVGQDPCIPSVTWYSSCVFRHLQHVHLEHLSYVIHPDPNAKLVMVCSSKLVDLAALDSASSCASSGRRKPSSRLALRNGGNGRILPTSTLGPSFFTKTLEWVLNMISQIGSCF